jgi:uncharacterized membrane protein YuzA (DUF378 family)
LTKRRSLVIVDLVQTNAEQILKARNQGMKPMKKIDVLAAVLLVVGGLNWGLVGAVDFDLVATVFGSASTASRIVYLLVGLGALYQVFQWKAIQSRWQPQQILARG